MSKRELYPEKQFSPIFSTLFGAEVIKAFN
jgi:hypothetical protein